MRLIYSTKLKHQKRCVRKVINGNVKVHKFKHKSDFDTNGLLYWLGTDGGTKAYTNPAVSGKVTLTVSHEKVRSFSFSTNKSSYLKMV